MITLKMKNMKKSNKLILTGALVLTLSYTTVLLFSKSYMTVTNKENLVEKGSGVKAEKLISSDSITGKVLIMDHQICTLDKSFDGIKIKTDDNLLDKFNLEKGRYWSIEESKEEYFAPSFETEVIIGVKSLSKLDLRLDDSSQIYHSDDNVNIDSLYLKLDDNVSGEININCEYLILRADENTQLKLSGTASKASVNLDDRADIYMRDLLMESLKVDLEGRSYLKIKYLEDVSGQMEDSAHLITDRSIDEEALEIFDGANIYLDEVYD